MSRKVFSSFIVALGLTCMVATRASAQNPFTINGSVPDPDITAGSDPTGNAKELGPVNASATKVGVINTAAAPMLDFTNPNGQVDLKNVWVKTKKAANGHVWLYFAWQRDANGGSGFISFEFEQSPVNGPDPQHPNNNCVYTGTGIDFVLPQTAAETSLINGCNPWKNRQQGDFLILWDQSGSALNITKRVYNGTAFGPVVGLGSAVAAIGSCAGVAGSNGFCGEAAIDLTVDVFGGANGCQNFANIIPGTVTGNSDSADYKDTVFSTFPNVSNCGSLKVTKSVQNGTTGSFPFTVTRAGGAALNFSGDTSLGTTFTKDGDTITYNSLIADQTDGTGSYIVKEGAQTSPWQFVSVRCTENGNYDQTSTSAVNGLTAIPVIEGATTECVITNTLQTGTLKIVKHVINDNGGSAVAGNFTISVGDDLATTVTGSESGVTVTLTLGKTFAVSEAAGQVSGYEQTGIVGQCTGTIAAGDNGTCTVTNNDKPVSLTLVKVVNNTHGGTATEANFTLTANGGTAGTLSGAGPTVSSPATFKKGIYALTESGPSGAGGPFANYTTNGYSCVKNNGQAATLTSITLDLGDSATCTITNNDTPAAPSLASVERAVLHDKLTITGIRAGGTPTATVTFRLYSDASCATQVGSDETVGINGSGVATTAVGVPVTGTGTVIYYWRAFYTGDSFNDVKDTGCGDEKTTVTFAP